MSRYDDAEREFLGGAGTDLAALSVARRATEALADAIKGATIDPATEDPPASYDIRSAMLVLSVLGLRTARACMLVVSAGYWPESHGLKRRLSEIHARAQAISEDESGQHTRDWLEGRGPSAPARLFNKFGSVDLWKLYSWGAHADVESAHTWLSEPMPPADSGDRGFR